MLAWPNTFHLAGDNHELAIPRTKANLTALEETHKKDLKVDVIRWDVCNLPLRTGSVDVVVTDLVCIIQCIQCTALTLGNNVYISDFIYLFFLMMQWTNNSFHSRLGKSKS